MPLKFAHREIAPLSKCLLCYHCGLGRLDPYCELSQCEFAPDGEKLKQIYPSLSKEDVLRLKQMIKEAEA